jgi:ATP-binding cassette subfamily B protein
LKGLGAERVRSARLAAEAEEVLQKGLDVARLRARFGPALDVLPSLGILAVLTFGGSEVLEGRLPIGQLVAASAYVVMLVVPLRSIGSVVVQAERALAAAHRVGEVLSTRPVIVDPPRPRALPRGEGELRFERVRFGYEPGRPVLDGFELRVEPGEAVALVGRSGAGKTTVARLVPRFYDVWEGRVLLDGADVRELRLAELRRAVGIVFEDAFLFSDTIAANIAFAEPAADLERIRAAAAAAGVDEFVSSLPQGYATVIGPRGLSLSGGQRQRLALARAILADPRVLVLDDATSAVDAEKEQEILEALRKVMAGRTTLLIAHRPATVALADRVVLVEHGRVTAEGTHAGLAATSERYRELLALSEPEAVAGGSR